MLFYPPPTLIATFMQTQMFGPAESPVCDRTEVTVFANMTQVRYLPLVLDSYLDFQFSGRNTVIMEVPGHLSGC